MQTTFKRKSVSVATTFLLAFPAAGQVTSHQPCWGLLAAGFVSVPLLFTGCAPQLVDNPANPQGAPQPVMPSTNGLATPPHQPPLHSLALRWVVLRYVHTPVTNLTNTVALLPPVAVVVFEETTSPQDLLNGQTSLEPLVQHYLEVSQEPHGSGAVTIGVGFSNGEHKSEVLVLTKEQVQDLVQRSAKLGQGTQEGAVSVKEWVKPLYGKYHSNQLRWLGEGPSQ